MPVKIHHAQITIPVGKESEAREFYSDFIGLEEIAKPESLKQRGGFWLRLDDIEIHVGTESDFDRTKTKAHLAYLVKDLDKWEEKLGSKNIRVTEGISIPGYRRFEFRDPFGNRVEFLQSV